MVDMFRRNLIIIFLSLLILAIPNIALGAQTFMPPVVGNIDDSTISDEILTTSFDGRLYAWKAERTVAEGVWPVEFSGVICAAPTLADLDANPDDLEILVPVCEYSGSYKLYGLQGNGAALGGWIKNLNFEVYSAAAVGYVDLNQDRQKEKLIFVGGRNGNVYGWKAEDWKTLGGWPKSLGAGQSVSPACADVDNDGNDEVIVASGSGKIVVFKYNNKEWKTLTSLDIQAGIAAAATIYDLEGDGSQELIVGATNGVLYVWSWNNKESKWVPKRSQAVGGVILTSPAVANFDLDKDLEIACFAGNGKIHIINNNGSILSSAFTALSETSGISQKGVTFPQILTNDLFYSYYGSGVTVAREGNPSLSITEWGQFHHFKQPYIMSMFASIDPFSPNNDGRKDSTVITSQIGSPQECEIKLGIYDKNAKLVKKIKDGRYTPSAAEDFTWDGKGDQAYNSSQPVTSETYNIIMELESAYSDKVNQLNTVTVDTIPPVISKVSETLKVITPDGDGSAEATTVFYAVSEPCEVTIAFKNAKGEVYRTHKEFVDTNLDPGPETIHSFTWDGKGDANQLFSGEYTYAVVAEDRAANQGSSEERKIIIDVDPPLINGVYADPKVFSTQSSINSTTIHYAVSEKSAVSIDVYTSDNLLVKTLLKGEEKSMGTYQVIWDGTNQSGEFLPDGYYTYKISAVDLRGFKSNIIDAVVEIDNTAPSILQASVVPEEFSPLAAMGTSTTLSFLVSEKASVSIQVLNSVGSVIRELTTDTEIEAGTHSFIWDGSDSAETAVSDGTYTFKIIAKDLAGNSAESVKTVTANSTPPSILNLSGSPDPFTPNGDALKDIFSIHYTLSGGIGEVRLSVKILDEIGSTVRTLIDNEPYHAGNYTDYWYGDVDHKGGIADSNNDGIVEDGVYTYQVTAVDSHGNQSQVQAQVTAISTKPTLIVSVNPVKFSPNGDGSIDTTLLSYSIDYASFYISDPATVVLSIKDAANQTVFTKAFSQTPGSYSFEWDGKRNDGSDITEGIYTIYIDGYDALNSRGDQRTTNVEIVYTHTAISMLGDSPDPFSPVQNGKKDVTVISYSLSKPSVTTIQIKDQADNLIQTLLDQELKQKDTVHTVVWDGKDSAESIVADGTYTYEIIATDDAGNISSTSGSVTVDDTDPAAPVLDIIATPTNQQVQTVSGTAENGSYVEIFDNGNLGASVTAASPFSTQINLSLGDNLIKARTTDRAGNVSVFGAEQTVHFETDAPVFTISADPSFAKEETITITVQASEALKQIPSLSVTQNGGSAAPVNMIDLGSDAYIGSYEVVTGYDGQARIDVSGTDLAGNVGAGILYFDVDTTPPEFSSVAAVPNPAKAGTVTITFQVSEDLSDNPDVTVNGNSASFASKNGDYYTYTYDVSASDQQGSAAIAIAADDLVGNPGTGSGSFTIDTIDPTFSGISAVPDPAKAGDVTIAFTASETLASDPIVKVNGNDASIDLSSSGLNYVYVYSVTVFDTNGASTISISGTDLAGNIGVDQSASFVIDTVAPTLNNIAADPDPAKEGAVIISFTASELLASDPAPTLTVNGNPTTLNPPVGLNYSFNYSVTALDNQGQAAIAVSGQDLAGNSFTDNTGSFVIDTVAPTLVLNGRGANPNPFTPNMLETTSFDFTVSDATTNPEVDWIKIYNADGDLVKTLGEGVVTWDGNVDGGVSDSNGDGLADEGTYSFTVHAVDDAGNATSQSGTLLVNRIVLHLSEPAPPTQKVNPTPFSPNVLPETIITFALDQDSNGPSWVQGMSIMGIQAMVADPIGTVRVEVRTLGGSLVRTILPNATDDGKREAGTHQITWDGRNNSGQIVSSGSYKIIITATDLVGNPAEDLASLTYDITVDTIPPSGSIKINNDAPYTTSPNVTLNLSASDAHSGVVKMRVSNDGNFDNEPIENYATTKAWTLTSGNDGSRTVYVRYQDASGNWSGSFSDSIIYDVTAPEVSISSINPSTFNQMYESTMIAYSINDGCSDQINYEAGIYTVSGTLVKIIRSYSEGLTSKGNKSFVWYGKNDYGDYVNEGNYKFKIRAKDKAGNESAWTIADIDAKDDRRLTTNLIDSIDSYFAISGNTLVLKWTEGYEDNIELLSPTAVSYTGLVVDIAPFYLDYVQDLNFWVHFSYDPSYGGVEWRLDGGSIPLKNDENYFVCLPKGNHEIVVTAFTTYHDAPAYIEVRAVYQKREYFRYTQTSSDFGQSWVNIPDPEKFEIYDTGPTEQGQHSVWSSNDEIWYKRGSSPSVKITNSSGIARNPAIAVDSGGNAYVAWEDNRDGNFEIYFQKIPSTFAPVSSNADSQVKTAAVKIGELKASQTTTLESPVLTAPEDAADVTSLRPTFQWQHHKLDTQEYKIDLAKNDTFSIDYQSFDKSANAGSTDKDDPTLYHYTYAIHEFDPGLDRDTYYWRVTALATTEAATSEVRSFTVAPDLTLTKITNYPNPFNPNREATKIRYRLGADADSVTIRIYDITGSLVRQIDNCPTDGEGSSIWQKYNDVDWDGRNGRGDTVVNGIYPYKIIARLGGRSISGRGKIAVLK